MDIHGIELGALHVVKCRAREDRREERRKCQMSNSNHHIHTLRKDRILTNCEPLFHIPPETSI